MEYRIEREGKPTAEGTTSLISFDYQARRPRRLPSAFRQAMTDFETIHG
jgi:acyl-CoA thioesterase FadM